MRAVIAISASGGRRARRPRRGRRFERSRPMKRASANSASTSIISTSAPAKPRSIDASVGLRMLLVDEQRQALLRAVERVGVHAGRSRTR